MVDVAIAAYPFTTIKPNFGVGFVRVSCPDKEFGVQCNPRLGYCIDHIRYVPVEMIDVAGLVPGAHEGKGLGNQFLNDLSQADVLIHVIDVSGSINEKGEAVPPLSYDPAKDIRFLEHEIDMWYFDVINRGWKKMAKMVKSTGRFIEDIMAEHLSNFKAKKEDIKEIITKMRLDSEKTTEWTEEQLKEIAVELRKITKPIVIACNKIDISGSEKNYERLKKEFPDYMLVPCSSALEVALRTAAKNNLIKYKPGDDKFEIISDKISKDQLNGLKMIEEFLKKFKSTGVQQCMDSAVFDFLKCIAIFPGGMKKLADREGNVMPDCFIMSQGTTALDFANKIHTEFGKNFLYAMDIRTRMKIGAEHKLKHRDVIEIISAAK